MRNVNLWTYTQNTPLDKWLNNDQLFRSNYLIEHVADFLRLLSLYKWGGTYLDLDVVVKTNLSIIGKNYAGAESDVLIANGVLNFDYKGIGHKTVTLCLK